jgi:hypothetical protein
MLWIAVVWLAWHERPELSHVFDICSAHVPCGAAVLQAALEHHRSMSLMVCHLINCKHDDVQDRDWDDFFNDCLELAITKKGSSYGGLCCIVVCIATAGKRFCHKHGSSSHSLPLSYCYVLSRQPLQQR